MKKLMSLLLVIAMVMSCVSMVTFAFDLTASATADTPSYIYEEDKDDGVYYNPERTATVYDVDFEDSNVTGYTPTGKCCGVVENNYTTDDEEHNNVFQYTPINTWSAPFWSFGTQLKEYSKENSGRNITVYFSLDLKFGTEEDKTVYTDNAKTMSTLCLRYSKSDTKVNDKSGQGFAAGYWKNATVVGEWVTAWAKRTYTPDEITNLSDDIRFGFDGIGFTNTNGVFAKDDQRTICIDNLKITFSIELTDNDKTGIKVDLKNGNTTNYARVGSANFGNDTVNSSYTGIYEYKFKLYNVGKTTLNGVYIYAQYGWTSFKSPYCLSPSVTLKPGEWAYVSFKLKFENGTVYCTDKAHNTTLSELSLRIDNLRHNTTEEEGGAAIIVPAEGNPITFENLYSIKDGNRAGWQLMSYAYGNLEDYADVTNIVSNAKSSDGTAETEVSASTGWRTFSAGDANDKVEKVGNDEVSDIPQGNYCAKFIPGGNSGYSSMGFDIGPDVIDDQYFGYYGGGVGTYKLSFWIKSSVDYEDTFNVSITSNAYKSKGSSVGAYTTTCHTYMSLENSVFKMTNGWTKLSFVFDITQEYLDNLKTIRWINANKNVYELIIRIDAVLGSSYKGTDENPGTQYSYYMDDVQIEKIDRKAVEYSLTSSTPETVYTNSTGGYLGTSYDAENCNDTIKKNFRIYNKSSRALSICTSLMAIYQYENNDNTYWTGPGTATTRYITLQQGQYIEFQLVLYVENGKVPCRYTKEPVAPSDFFLRIDVKSPQSGDKFILQDLDADFDGGDSKPELKYSKSNQDYTVSSIYTEEIDGYEKYEPAGARFSIPTTVKDTDGDFYYTNVDITNYVKDYLNAKYANYTGTVTFNFDVYNIGDKELSLDIFLQSGANGYNTPKTVSFSGVRNLKQYQMGTVSATYKIENGALVANSTDANHQFTENNICLRFNTVGNGINDEIPGAEFIVVPKELDSLVLNGYTGNYVSTAITEDDIPATTTKVTINNADVDASGYAPFVCSKGTISGIADGEQTVSYKVYNPTDKSIKTKVSLHSTVYYDETYYGIGTNTNAGKWAGISSNEKYIAPHSYQTFDISFKVESGKITFKTSIGKKNNENVEAEFSVNVSDFFLRFDFNGFEVNDYFAIAEANGCYNYVPTTNIKNTFAGENYCTVENLNKTFTDLGYVDPTVKITYSGDTGALAVHSGAVLDTINANSNTFYASRGRITLCYNGDKEFMGVTDVTDINSSITYTARTGNLVDINVKDTDITIQINTVSEDDSKKIVNFYNNSGICIDCVEIENDVSIDDIPSAPTRVGMTFAGWIFDGNDNYYTTDGLVTAINAFEEEGIHTASMVYTPQTFTITATTVDSNKDVIDGATVTITNAWGKTQANNEYESFAYAKVTAPEIDGKVFSHWEDESGNPVSRQEKYSFYVLGKDVTLKAVYVDNEDDKTTVINYHAITTNSIDTAQATDKSAGPLTMVAERAFDSSVTVISHGIMFFASDSNELTEEQINTRFASIYANGTNTDNGEYKQTSKYANRLGSYILTKKSTEAGKYYYVAVWSKYRDASGNVIESYRCFGYQGNIVNNYAIVTVGG